MTTGLGKLLIALSVKLGRFCAAPERTDSESLLLFATASEITCAFDTVPTWAAACAVTVAIAAPRRHRRSQEREEVTCETGSRLLNNCLEVQRAGVRAGHQRLTG